MTIQNMGAGELIVTSVAKITGSAAITLDATPTLPQLLDAAQSVNFTVRCSPTITGSVQATFRVTSNDPNNLTKDVVFTCKGGDLGLVAPPDITASFCATSGTVHVGTATVSNVCQNIQLTGKVISTNGVTLPVPINVTNGDVVLGIGTHVIKWSA